MEWKDWEAAFSEPLTRYQMFTRAYASESPLQQLYIGVPEGVGRAPVVVFIHGGGLTGDNFEYPQGLFDGTVAGVLVRYRVDGAENSLRDSAAAVAWVFAHAEEIGCDPRLVFVGGMSAGAWLGAMIGMDGSWLQKYGCDYRKIAGLLPVSGQMGTHFQVKKERHYPQAAWAPVIDRYAPLNYVAPDIAPVCLITGDFGVDMPTRAEENAYMAACLREVGHPDARHYALPAHSHGDVLHSAAQLMRKFINRRAGEIAAV